MKPPFCYFSLNFSLFNTYNLSNIGVITSCSVMRNVTQWINQSSILHNVIVLNKYRWTQETEKLEAINHLLSEHWQVISQLGQRAGRWNWEHAVTITHTSHVTLSPAHSFTSIIFVNLNLLIFCIFFRLPFCVICYYWILLSARVSIGYTWCPSRAFSQTHLYTPQTNEHTIHLVEWMIKYMRKRNTVIILSKNMNSRINHDSLRIHSKLCIHTNKYQ